MSITLKKINDKVIKPVKTKEKLSLLPVRGKDLIPTPYANIGIIARKKSGKSTVVFNLVKQRAGVNTKVIVFSSTFHKDSIMIEMKKWCKKHKIKIEGFTSMRDGKYNILKTFLDKLGDIPESEEESDISSEEEKVGRGMPLKKMTEKMFGNGKNFRDDEEEEESDDDFENDVRNLSKKSIDLFKFEEKVISKLFDKKSSIETHDEIKEKYLTPEYIFIFDDLSNELKDPNLVAFLKKNRHFKADTITSTQYIHDLSPSQLKQMDYLLLFRGMDEDKLEKIRRDADLTLDIDTFSKVYENATKEPFCFLYIDRLTETYRKCFDKQYYISPNKQ